MIEVDTRRLNYNKAVSFFHCKDCIEQFLGSELHESMTPREYGLYEVSNYEFEYPNGEKAMIIAVWCKRCERSVWDSRDMEKMY